jgi:hypothetical protein
VNPTGGKGGEVHHNTTPVVVRFEVANCYAAHVVVDVTLPAATARAEECLAAPNFPAREGTRWYYRLERATQHKCWYMRALGQPTPQAGAPAKTTLRAPAFGIPVPRPRPLTADSSPVGTDLSPSHAEGIERDAPSQWIHRRSKEIHFTASRVIVGRTSAKRYATRGNRRKHVGDFGDTSSSAIAGDYCRSNLSGATC